MMKKSIIIIGAGISGLSAGCYGQMKGFETTIFEMNDGPGGLCTSWNRKGYLIDGCIEWLVGTNPDNFMYDCWKEIGALEGKELIYHDYLMKVKGEGGKNLTLYSNVDRLEAELISVSPEDSAIIKEFTDAIRKSTPFSKTSPGVIIEKFLNMSMESFLNQLKDSFLRDALSAILLPMQPSEYTVGGVIFRLSLYNRKDACWPAGGSREFAKGIEKKYLSLGGKVKYHAEVEEILINNDVAVGVRLTDGSEHYADHVISAIDACTAIFGLLKGKYVDESIKGLVKANKPLLTAVQVSLCINCNLSDEPHALGKRLKEPLIIGEKVNHYVCFKNFSYDPTLSISGQTVITSLLATDFEFWENLNKEPDRYKAEKERIARRFIEAAEESFPQVKGKIEEIDVATPLTYQRYTGVWKGAFMGGVKFPKSLPGLSHFHLTGQWTEANGSLPAAMMSGKGCIEELC